MPPRTRSKRKIDPEQDEIEEKQNINKKQKQQREKQKSTIKGKKRVKQEEEEEEENVEETKKNAKEMKKSTAKKSTKKKHQDEDEDDDDDDDMDEDRDEEDDEDEDDDDDGNSKNKDNKKSQNKDKDNDDEEEKDERPQLDKVSIPSWSSITLPPITSHPCDIPGTTDKSKVISTHIYGKGICKDIFQGNECKDTSSEHRTQFFHELTPAQRTSIAKNKKKVTMTDLFPIYGHPALAYTWKYDNENNKHENKNQTREAVKSTGLPNDIVNMVMENTAPSINIFWRADVIEEDDDDDDENDDDEKEEEEEDDDEENPHSDAAKKTNIQEWTEKNKHLLRDVVVVPRHPKRAIRSHLGGIGYLRKNEKQPKCGQCDKMMLLYVQLRLSDMPRDAAIGYALPGIPIQRQLLQCWGCPREQHDQNASSSPPTDDDMKDNEGEGSGVLIRIIDMGDDTEKIGDDTNNVDVMKKNKKEKEEDQDQDENEDEDDDEPLTCQLIKKWIEYTDTPSVHEWNDLLHLYNDEEFKQKYHDDDYDQDQDNIIKLGGYCDINVDVSEDEHSYSTCPICDRTMQIVIQLPSNNEIYWGSSGVKASIQQCPVHRDHFVFAWDEPQDHF